jgi:hypothetical protein
MLHPCIFSFPQSLNLYLFFLILFLECPDFVAVLVELNQ